MAPDLHHLNNCNAPANETCSNTFSFVLADRVRKNFTTYQLYFFGETGTWWEDPGTFRLLNVSAFKARVDVVMGDIADAGLLAAFGIGMHSMSFTVPLDSLTAIADYAAARYGAHPIVWITAQEVNAPNSNATAWKVAAQHLSAGTGNGAPLSAHMWVFENETTHTEPFIYGNETWHNWFATQGGHTGMGIRTNAHYAAYWNWRNPTSGLPIPFLESEAMYEGVICGPTFAHANDTRAAAWKSTLSGSLGFTYGAAALWLFKYDLNDTTGSAYNPNTWWYPNLALPGSTQVSLMSLSLGATGLLASSWDTLTPLFASQQHSQFAQPEDTVLAMTNAGARVLYSFGNNRTLGELRGLSAGVYDAQWLNAQTGEYSELPSVTLPPNATWTLPERPDDGDSALFLVPHIPK